MTVSLRPLCQQPAQPGPDSRRPVSSSGPTELVAGLYLEGGPVQTSPHCRHGTPSSGILTVTTPDGRIVTRRAVRAGRFAVFPLKPGRYLLAGSVAGPGQPQVEPQPVTIAAHRTTRLNVVADVY